MNRTAKSIFLKCLSVAILIISFSATTFGATEIVWWDKWTEGSVEGEFVVKVVEEFNSSQSKIQVKYVPTSDIATAGLVAIAGGTPPDIMGSWNHQLGPYADKKVVRPVEEMMEAVGFSKDLFEPLALELATYKGTLFAIPLNINLITLQYNKMLFADYGIAHPPATIADLELINEKFLEINQAGDYTRMGFVPHWPNWWAYYWPWPFGGSFFDANGKPTINSEENVKAYEWLGEYTKKCDVTKVKKFVSGLGEYYSNTNPFMAQKLAMELMGSWDPPMMEPFIQGRVEYGATPFPVADDRVAPFVMGESDIFFIPANAKHPKEAMVFLKWLLEKGNPLHYSISSVASWNEEALARGVETSLLYNPLLGLELRTAAPINEWAYFNSSLEKEMDGLLYGEKDVTKVLNALQQDMQRKIR